MKKYLLYVVMAMAAAAYLTIPACGNKNGNQNVGTVYPGGYATCIPGQVCTGALGGVALIPAPATFSIDNRGSYAQIAFSGTQYVAGQQYSGPVNATGVINIAVGGPCTLSGPLSMQVQSSSLTWTAGAGGAIAGVQGTMVGVTGNFQVQMQGFIYQGTDPTVQTQTGYYFQGIFQTSCDPTGIAE